MHILCKYSVFSTNLLVFHYIFRFRLEYQSFTIIWGETLNLTHFFAFIKYSWLLIENTNLYSLRSFIVNDPNPSIYTFSPFDRACDRLSKKGITLSLISLWGIPLFLMRLQLNHFCLSLIFSITDFIIAALEFNLKYISICYQITSLNSSW